MKYVTNIKSKMYFEEQKYKMEPIKGTLEMEVIQVYPDIERQEWLGMGAALTQSSNTNYLKLTSEKQKELLDCYFSIEGLNYDYIRLPIGSCDFSPISYSYVNKKDGSDFSLEKDEEFLFPMLYQVRDYKQLTYLSVPWSPPSIWKRKKKLYQGDSLKKEYYSNYARYLIRYIQEMKERGIDIAYMSMQNEPFASQTWESCEWTIEEQKEFIQDYFIPELSHHKLETKLLLWDHNKEDLYRITKELYNNQEEVAGVCFHWYSGGHYEQLSLIHEKYPHLLLIESEMCCGYSSYLEEEWSKDASYYIKEIINNIHHGMNLWFDWNLLLDYYGGPNHKNNYCKSPIILNEEGNDYIKTPIYYFLKHLSVIPTPSKVVFTSSFTDDLLCVAMKNDDNLYVVIYNQGSEAKKYHLVFDRQFIDDELEEHSVVTYIL